MAKTSHNRLGSRMPSLVIVAWSLGIPQAQ